MRSPTADSQTAGDRLAATLSLDESIAAVPQVSFRRAQALQKLSIRTIRDLVTHYPRRYIDMTALLSVGSTRIGATGTIIGRIEDVTLKRPRRNLSIVEIALMDGTGVLIVTFFGQPWLADQLKVGETLAVAGTVEFKFGFKQMTSPHWEKIDEAMTTGRIIPVHPASQNVSAQWMRRLIRNALIVTRGLHDPMPVALRRKYRLMSRGQALWSIHLPATMEDAAQARRRLAYEELLLLELHLMLQSRDRSQGQSPRVHRVEGPLMRRWREALPFPLTDDQRKATDELLGSMAEPSVMNRLLLGDVGTGKAIVAAFGIVACAESGTQALMMAPTEVLARQHFESLAPMLDSIGVRAALLTGATDQNEREETLEAFADGSITVLIGTHALLEPDVRPRALTLTIIDEQQRFGVEQRRALLDKSPGADALSLTATPIPRTLALALYGDMSLSYLTERPHPLMRTTRVLPKKRQGDAYEAALVALERGEQVYVVCPLIRVSSGSKDTPRKHRKDEDDDAYAIAIEDDRDYGTDAAGAIRKAELLQSGVFRDYEVGLLHGGLSSTEKMAVMERFRTGACQVLVATTIIEVGVDVPAASVMIIEDADRFGLSQLHQLRGRVGRGGAAAEVYLLSAATAPAAIARLEAMERTDDGFELAAYDLSLRREGDILGNRQHGASVLKLVNVIRDGAIIEAAHEDAAALLEGDPALEKPDHRALAREVRLLFGGESQSHTT